ncbi:uncharacterized protein ASPGLDRAFT_42875 [Aspergillus glaucus CBS 516.65]|uniref:Uncharacterized protein n=1 Tax=Aspergillus glaucus CBS 516.65 TaxID=1160497 RepID=A0A1L9VV77_ASPGL|nr:hypothetical protein ASPGLDRAFT_42875 [Aspergillus glaucus CBS 516.65]OJJ87806.1 hypothetical protein ASPGLDRAFT_42875 [Aspergillus glaucus CBS 516.65]
MNDNMKTLVNINSHTLTQQLTQLEKAVKSLANQTKFLAATASAISKTVNAHEIELRDLHPVKAAHDRGRWCVLYEWAGIRNDGLRALCDAAVHGGDITTDTRLLSSLIDESEENVEALRAAFREHYGIDLKTASGNIAIAPPYVVEACDVLADVRSLGFWRESEQQLRRNAIEDLGRQIVNDWLRGEKLDGQILLKLRTEYRG